MGGPPVITAVVVRSLRLRTYAVTNGAVVEERG